MADVLQVVRERLFLGSAPRIRAYNATAPLAQWVKVVAIRTAIDLHRRELAAAPPAHYHHEATRGTETDAQTRVMQQEYKREFETALRGLIDALPTRDRTVLRLHLIEEVSLEKLAVMYGVHRVTLARWVWNAGEILLASACGGIFANGSGSSSARRSGRSSACPSTRRFGATARKPSLANQSAWLRTSRLIPSASWMTTTPGHGPSPGVVTR